MNLRPITAGVLYPNINVAQGKNRSLVIGYIGTELTLGGIEPPAASFWRADLRCCRQTGHGGGWHTAALLPMTRFGDYFSFRRIMRKSSRACVCHPLFSCYSSDTPTSSSTIHAPDPAPRRCMYVLPTVRGLFSGYSSRRLLPIFCPVYGFTFVIL